MNYEKLWERAKEKAERKAKSSYPDNDARQEYMIMKFTLEEYNSLTTPSRTICKLCGK